MEAEPARLCPFRLRHLGTRCACRAGWRSGHGRGRWRPRGAIFPLLETATVPTAAAFSRRPERTPGGSEGTRALGVSHHLRRRAPPRLYVRAASGTNQNGARRRPLGTAPISVAHLVCSTPVARSCPCEPCLLRSSRRQSRRTGSPSFFRFRFSCVLAKRAHQDGGQKRDLLVEGTRKNSRRSAPPRRFRMRAPR